MNYYSTIHFFIAAAGLVQSTSASQVSVGLRSTALFAATATAHEVASGDEHPVQISRLRGNHNLDEVCGPRGHCTNGATCNDDVCECGAGWVPDPSITPVGDAGWRSCIAEDECLTHPCTDMHAACVNHDPPVRFTCDCPKGKKERDRGFQ